jgi:hypothetical protein
MDSENNYDIEPVNSSCNNIINDTVIINSPGSTLNNSDKDIISGTNQHDADAQYDNVDNISVKPLYGGIKTNILFTIKFRNKIININSDSEYNAIKLFLNNKIYKKDNLLEISYKNKFSLYIIKNSYKNKFIKMN